MIDIALTTISFGVVFVNMALLSWLLWTFYGSYRELRSPFGKGLVIFSLVLLIQQIAYLISLVYINLDRGPTEGGILFVINLIELVALVFLFRIARE
jgi:hypothetical protein